MKILLTGSSGFIGSALRESLPREEYEIHCLLRTQNEREGLFWNPDADQIDLSELGAVDAVIHLAGENLASGRWTSRRKERIFNSRVDGTLLLVRELNRLEHRPKVILSASATGFYGNRGSEWLDESSQAGSGFLAKVCIKWEEVSQEATQTGIRVVNLRTGLVLGTMGGALQKMLLPFQLGLGGKIGDGHQYMSWIVLHDWIRAIKHIIQSETLEGPVNLVTPNPVTNLEFTQTLGKVLHRPTLLPLPEKLAHLGLGEMADELLLSGCRVAPRKLLDSGFTFKHPELAPALQYVLSKYL
ncbi:MAG: TIGR01777 family protein [SAR324 cluster bacterium]|uniref:TIGR01777 family protein n=1 Tax=SAR324 cluster bacterium TaxID=2024889 RepID=A0A2A4T7F3_9DELT|nr:MAG: TIGR01777 family protein [SAR324 cluster bacterium]